MKSIIVAIKNHDDFISKFGLVGNRMLRVEGTVRWGEYNQPQHLEATGDGVGVRVAYPNLRFHTPPCAAQNSAGVRMG